LLPAGLPELNVRDQTLGDEEIAETPVDRLAELYLSHCDLSMETSTVA
jgi:hypothetical protein